jgi:CHAT domain-containing protein
VHVSGHGQSDLAQPDNSALLLAPPPTLEADAFAVWLAAAEEWIEVDEEERHARVPGVGSLHERRLLDGDWIERTMDLPGRCTIWSHERHGQLRAVAERWSAGDLAVDDALGTCALTVLSACESALGSLNVGIDEQSGLPAALALAGAGTVIATQWPVDEGVAAVTVELLYDELSRRRGEVDLPAVVDQLRRRLRQLRSDEAAALIEGLRQRVSAPRPRLLLEATARRLRRGDPHAFARPWDWAAFVVVGKGTIRIEDTE